MRFQVAMPNGEQLILYIEGRNCRLLTPQEVVILSFDHFAFSKPTFESGRLQGIASINIRRSNECLPFVGCVLMDTTDGAVIGPFQMVEEIS